MRRSRASAAMGVLALTGLIAAGPAAHAESTRLLARSPSSPWSQIGPPGGYVESVAFDPKKPATVYVGTFNGGVFKSINTGTSWKSAGLQGDSISALAVDPSNDAIVYAAGFGLWVSTNGGVSWTENSKLANVQVNALAVDPENGSVIYAATPTDGVYKTTNAGATWSEANTGLTATWVNDIVVAPSTPSTLYAATTGGMFTSTNSGGSWSAVNSGISGLFMASVAVDPTNASSVWAANATFVYYSDNAGASWSEDATDLPRLTFPAPLILTSSTVYVGVDGKGIYEEPISGTSWTATGEMTDPDGLPTADFEALATDPADPSVLFVGTKDGGLFKTTDGANSWSIDNSGLLANGITALAGVPSDENLIYAATSTLGLFVSSDGGKTWTSAKGTDGATFNTITVDPTTPSTVWAGGFDGIYKTTDNGEQWTAMTSAPSGADGIAVDPFDSATVYATVLSRGVYETTNGGASWRAVNKGLTNVGVTCIAADPTTKGLLYVGTISGVFTSSNGGSSWTELPTAGLRSLGILSIVDGEPTVGEALGVSEFVVAGKYKYWQSATLLGRGGKEIAVTSCYVIEKDKWKWMPKAGTYTPATLIVAVCAQGVFAAWKSEQSVETFYEGPKPSGQLTGVSGFAADPLWLMGTSGNDIYALPSSAPIFSAPASSTTSRGSATATVPPGQKANTAGSLTVGASTGKGTVTVDDYFGDPSSVQVPLSTNFFGVSLSSGNTFKSVAIEDCQYTDSKTVVEWLDGTKWVKVSKQSYNKTSGCVLVTVNATTSPALKKLGAAVFASTG